MYIYIYIYIYIYTYVYIYMSNIELSSNLEMFDDIMLNGVTSS